MKLEFQISDIIILFLLTLILFSMSVPNPMHSDESIFIFTSLYLEKTLQLDLSEPAWDISFFTLCATMLPRYFIGASRYIAGYDIEQLNEPYNIGISPEENLAQGRVPEPGLLFASRIPMIIFTIFALMFFYLLLKRSVHWLAGLAFLGLALFNPLIPTLMLRAMSEAPLMAFFIITCLLLVGAQKHWLRYAANPDNKKELKQSYLYFILCGVGVGLAASSKINAFAVGFSMPFLMVYLIFFAKNTLSKQDKIKLFIRLGLCFVFAAIITFIVLNPFLYPQPIVRMGLLLKYRVQELSQQVNQVPQEQVIAGNLPQRWFAIFGKLLSEYSTFNFHGAVWINLVLFLTGLGRFFWMVVRDFKNREVFSLLTITMVTSLPIVAAAFFTPLWWPRYFLFPQFFFLFMIAIGFWFITRWSFKWTQSKFQKASIES